MTKVRSYGSVFLASRNDGEGTVAIKQAKLGHKSSMNHVTSEITMLSYLSHPNVIKLEDCFLFENEEESGDQTLWMVLEYMNGGAIARLLRKKSTTKVLWWLSEPEVAYVTKQVGRRNRTEPSKDPRRADLLAQAGHLPQGSEAPERADRLRWQREACGLWFRSL